MTWTHGPPALCQTLMRNDTDMGPCLRRGDGVRRRSCISRPVPLCAPASGHGHPWRRGRKAYHRISEHLR
ncbi:hypothetical protein SPHINGO8AM_190083 [Sphingomonas sp. 8AM]|nr:hypothetical protein SPHINGO8AM_190083 [Sphingomonas sp. 8AM]